MSFLTAVQKLRPIFRVKWFVNSTPHQWISSPRKSRSAPPPFTSGKH